MADPTACSPTVPPDRTLGTRRRSSGIPVPSPPTPRASNPPAPPQSALSEGQQPRRDVDTLFVSFPAPHVFKCPEEGCSAAYTAAAWTAKRQSLQRHLEGDPGMRIRRTVNLCTLCGATLGTRPTSHPCLANGRAAAAPTQQRHQCTRCPHSFPSRKGLHNHLQWHTKEEAKQMRAASSQASTLPMEEAQRPPATLAACNTPMLGTHMSLAHTRAPIPGPACSSMPDPVASTPESDITHDEDPTGTSTEWEPIDDSCILQEHTRQLRRLATRGTCVSCRVEQLHHHS
ncbi:uncharacterized protein LOC120842483 [Ixodes scapularis]|uniref:uncharacterized protein LOC120842483 n=1 Tax=Ixodes scapularis TaxID=6945 RepID=UPI001A9D259C|nr:uncharacterized protein LOC120842483 [Ixodes scapularis]